MTLTTSLKEKLSSGRTIVGSWLEIPHIMVAESMAQTGVDFLVFDGEHGPNPVHELLQVLPGTEKYQTPVIYRVPWNRPEYIKAALDTGASGVMIPMVNSGAEAAAAVAAAKYPPEGSRGLGPWRASQYYQNSLGYRNDANRQSVVIVQIETTEAVDAIDEIAATPGIDVLYVGPGDLALSMGIETGTLDDRLLDACRTVAAAARSNGLVPGIDLARTDFIPELRATGMALFTHGIDYRYILTGGIQTCREMRTLSE